MRQRKEEQSEMAALEERLSDRLLYYGGRSLGICEIFSRLDDKDERMAEERVALILQGFALKHNRLDYYPWILTFRGAYCGTFEIEKDAWEWAKHILQTNEAYDAYVDYTRGTN